MRVAGSGPASQGFSPQLRMQSNLQCDRAHYVYYKRSNRSAATNPPAGRQQLPAALQGLCRRRLCRRCHEAAAQLAGSPLTRLLGSCQHETVAVVMKT